MTDMKTSARRPRAVTIIAWFFIGYALVSAIPKLLLLVSPEAYQSTLEMNRVLSGGGFIQVPFPYQMAHALIGVPVFVISGIFMLNGRRWALVSFLLWIFGVLLFTFIVSGVSIQLYAKMFVAGIITVLLTRPGSLAYFSSSR